MGEMGGGDVCVRFCRLYGLAATGDIDVACPFWADTLGLISALTLPQACGDVVTCPSLSGRRESTAGLSLFSVSLSCTGL